MKDLYTEFAEIYKNKPLKDNTGGMMSQQMFGLFTLLKEMNPALIIESGVWYGQGTWFMRQVCPDAKIISFDINFGNLKYKHPDVEYHERDITTFDWQKFFQENTEYNSENSLLFLDDHVDFSSRLSYLYESTPFKHIVYEDNYPPNQGDCISPKKIRESETCIIDKAGYRTEFQIPSFVREMFEEKVKNYKELPPVCIHPQTRWNDDWDREIYKTPEPVFTNYDEVEDWVKEEKDYTWICHMELNK